MPNSEKELALAILILTRNHHFYIPNDIELIDILGPCADCSNYFNAQEHNFKEYEDKKWDQHYFSINYTGE